MISNIVSIFVMAILPITASVPEQGLAFYLVKGVSENKEANVSGLDNLQVEKTPLLTQSDIISYSVSNQSMILTEGALTKLKGVSIGSSFVVCVNGKPIYAGKIWSPLRSASCPEIVIMVPPGDNTQVSLLAGYPTHSYFIGIDQRSNKAILEALEASNKLK